MGEVAGCAGGSPGFHAGSAAGEAGFGSLVAGDAEYLLGLLKHAPVFRAVGQMARGDTGLFAVAVPDGDPPEPGRQVLMAVETETFDILLHEGREIGAVGFVAFHAMAHPPGFVVVDRLVFRDKMAIETDRAALPHNSGEFPAFAVGVVGPNLFMADVTLTVPGRSVEQGGRKD